MKWDELKPGLPVRITAGYHAGKTGKVLAVGTFEGGPYRIGALVDILEPLLVIVGPEALEELPEYPLLPGWEEFEV
ncbi:hypothetical protein [Paenibacillus wynnii]|uniref:KOW domain-containing protein n=1 Tax=Paenibacillus wynnii TaxID=268407 RepID=A0A098MHV0_9BACL|nr:hypothetical protein [Paenibacillus wynnii]KGE21097.1 hypothetical protein PWYN_02885 [Paenibacillus wynnii]